MTSFSYRAKAAALVLFSSGAFVPSVPVEAASVIARCAIPQPCAIYLNSAGWGFQAITEATTGFHAGLQGADISTDFGSNDGVLGTVNNGGYGVEGRAGNGGQGGVLGTANGNFSVGVDGQSASGFGVHGETSDGSGVVADALGSGTAVSVHSNTGDGIDVYSVGSTAPNTVAGEAVYAISANGVAGDFRGKLIGLLGSAPATGFPLTLITPSGNTLFSVDGNGNVTQHGTMSAFARTAAGGTVKAYIAKSTLPTVEDTGTAQLVRGTATVRFDAAFEASIDPSVAYRVFVTPSGDTHGLFVPTKTATGFVVREAQGGRATVSFDYRVVATALGQTHLRMALVPATEADAKVAAPPVPALKPLRPARRSERQRLFVNDLNLSKE